MRSLAIGVDKYSVVVRSVLHSPLYSLRILARPFIARFQINISANKCKMLVSDSKGSIPSQYNATHVATQRMTLARKASMFCIGGDCSTKEYPGLQICALMLWIEV